MSEESIKSKRIASNTILLYFRMLFLLVINLYASRIILDALGVNDYGIYNIVGGFVSMFSIISAPLTSSCSRFLNYEMGKGNKWRINTVFSTSVIVHVTIAVLIALLCEIIGIWYINNLLVVPSDRLFAAQICFQFSILIFCINIVTIPYNAAIIANERMKVFAYISVFEGIAKLSVCFLIFYSHFDKLILYGFLLLIIQLIVRIVYQWYCKTNFDECKLKFEINRSLISQMLSYSGWQFIGHSSRVLENHGINLLLNFFFGPALNAARGIATQVLGTVEGFANNFMIALNPQITQNYAEGNIKYMLKLIFYGSRFSFFLLLLFSLPIIVNADFLLGIWLKQVPDYAIVFVKLSLVCALIASLSNTLITAQNATGRVRNYQITIGGIRLLNLPLSYLFLKMGYDALSVMTIAIFIEIFCLFVRLYILPTYIKAFSVHYYFKEVIFPSLLVSSIVFIFLSLLKLFIEQSNFASFLFTIFSFVITLCFILFLGCTHNERIIVYSKVLFYLKKRKV